MHTTSFLLDKIEECIENLTFNDKPRELYAPVKYMLRLGGKRIRPLLTLIACEMFGRDYRKALLAAAGIELFHNFTLLHDDIMDNSPLRRGKPTVHTKWNINTAILAGDVLFVKSFSLLVRGTKGEEKATELFSKTAVEVCEGQQLDMSYESMDRLSIEAYMNMIALKTAVLPAACLRIGALIGGADEARSKLLYDAGKNFGIAFQLQDDLLDLYSDTVKFGKQKGGDIISKKKTWLYLKSLEIAPGREKKKLMNLYADEELSPPVKIRKVKMMFDSMKMDMLLKNEIQKYYAQSVLCLDRIKLPESKTRPLRKLIGDFMMREK